MSKVIAMAVLREDRLTLAAVGATVGQPAYLLVRAAWAEYLTAHSELNAVAMAALAAQGVRPSAEIRTLSVPMVDPHGVLAGPGEATQPSNPPTAHEMKFRVGLAHQSTEAARETAEEILRESGVLVTQAPLGT